MSELRNIADIIDRERLGAYQIRVAVLCFLTLVLDGFDNQAIGFVAPALKAAWHFGPGALGPVFTASVIGVGLGSLLIGPFADRFGRARVLIATMLLFAVFSALIAQSTNIGELLVLRFCMGLGLGAVIPLVVVLCSEYAPRRHRAKMVTLMTCGYAAGAASGGFIAVHLVPVFGWAAVFQVGAALPLLLAVLLALGLPESLRYLTLRDATPRILAILRRINPALQFPPDVRFHMPAEDRHAATSRDLMQVQALFSENRARLTLLLWACLFMNLIDLNFLNNWLPTLVIQTGLSSALALRAATALQFGGIVGIIAMGFLADRFGYYRVLGGVFAVGSVAVALIGVIGPGMAGLVGAIFVAGFAVIGSQMTLAALSATLYPTRIRATGSSWAFGVARLLSMVGPLFGGIMLGAGWPLRTIFLVAGAPLVVAVLVVIAMARPAVQRAAAILPQAE